MPVTARLAIASLCGALLVAGLTGTAAAANLAETARFLAGKGVAADSAQQPNLERMRTWWTGRGPAKYSTVFYPFSGPDIGNALALFPDADTYLLFGLEPLGAIPDLQAMDGEAIAAGLNELEASLGTILQVNYFFTKAMAKKLGNGSFSSITGLLLFFLAMNDCEVTGARTLAISPTSGHSRAPIPGVEISFTRNGSSKAQTLRYFSVDVADAQLAKSSPDFFPYLQRQGRFVTVIKSASYLMHQEGIAEPAHFAKIRSLILAQSDLVVQDDSGVPLRLFARDTWKLRFHGRYDAPTQEFGKYLQQDLRVEMQRNSTGRLPFSYGYAYKQGESNLMTMERLQ